MKLASRPLEETRKFNSPYLILWHCHCFTYFSLLSFLFQFDAVNKKLARFYRSCGTDTDVCNVQQIHVAHIYFALYSYWVSIFVKFEFKRSLVLRYAVWRLKWQSCFSVWTRASSFYFVNQCFHNKIAINQPMLIKSSGYTYNYMIKKPREFHLRISVFMRNLYNNISWRDFIIHLEGYSYYWKYIK